MSNIVSDIKIDSNKEFSQDVCLNVSTFFKGPNDVNVVGILYTIKSLVMLHVDICMMHKSLIECNCYS